ncbi:MAG: HAMP domain-containing sensor histidine kinase, partial [Mycobacteriales bacterium]
LVSAGLIRGAARGQELSTLSRLTRVVVAGFDAAPKTAARAFDRSLAAPGVASRLGIVVVPMTRAGLPIRNRFLAEATPPADLEQAVTGPAFARTVSIAGRSYLVAGSPRAGGGGFMVYEPAAAAGTVSASLRGRLLLALLAGLAVAALAGGVLARRLARPLQQAAGAAHRLAQGERAVRVVVAGPAEVAEVSSALNALAEALSVSEGRQRQFLLSVSHELRTPLTAIRGYAEALADGLIPPAEQAATGATLLAEAERLTRLVSDLLDLARLGADDFRIDTAQVDLAALVAEAGRVWGARCEREGVALRMELPQQALVAETDAGRLRQILDGLAENALRVTPKGAPIVFALRAEADAAVLEVRDGGPGLSDDDLAVAFERSALHDRYRAQRRVGTGVGLALIAGLARRLGGSAEAGHSVEGGASFRVRFPVTSAPAPAAA